MTMAVDAIMPNDGLVKPQASAVPMGQEPKAISKDAQLDPTNPLLDETAKELDNSDSKFVAKAKPVTGQMGQTIKN